MHFCHVFQEQNECKTYPVNKSTFLSNVPSGMVFAFTSFHFQKGCVFVLVPQTALEAGENSLGIQSSGLWCHFSHCNDLTLKTGKNRENSKQKFCTLNRTR